MSERINGWKILGDYTKERRGSRRKRKPRDIILLVAFFGTPASELGRIIGCDSQLIADESYAFTPAQLDRLASWLGAAYWRYSWRSGHPDASKEPAIREAANYIEPLLFVPDDFIRDLSWAVADLMTLNKRSH